MGCPDWSRQDRGTAIIDSPDVVGRFQGKTALAQVQARVFLVLLEVSFSHSPAVLQRFQLESVHPGPGVHVRNDVSQGSDQLFLRRQCGTGVIMLLWQGAGAKT